MQKTTIGQYFLQTDESNLQKQNTKLRNEIMNLKANNYISVTVLTVPNP